MVTADKRMYVNADGETVEATPHEYAIMYKYQGYRPQTEVTTEDISNPDVDTSMLEVPDVNAAIETEPMPVEAARHNERRRDKPRD